MITVIETLRALAAGANPDTGELLPKHSIAQRPESIRLLYCLCYELESFSKKSTRSALTQDEKRMRNISEGRPPRSHFPWDDDELKELAKKWKEGTSIPNLAKTHERSRLAVIAQLERYEIIDSKKAENLKLRNKFPTNREKE